MAEYHKRAAKKSNKLWKDPIVRKRRIDGIKNLQILCNKCHSKQHEKHNSRNNIFIEGDLLRGVRLILHGLRLNLNDKNFIGTPERVVRSYYEIFE